MTWLLTGKENGIYYGYADLMMGVVEWGSLFTRDEILAVEGPFGLKVERDLHFKADPDAKYLNMVSLAGIWIVKNNVLIFDCRTDTPSPVTISKLTLKYPTFRWFDYSFGSCDVCWIFAKNKKMAASLYNTQFSPPLMGESAAVPKDFNLIGS